MARVNFGQLSFTKSTKVKDNKKHHKVHIIIFKKGLVLALAEIFKEVKHD